MTHWQIFLTEACVCLRGNNSQFELLHFRSIKLNMTRVVTSTAIAKPKSICGINYCNKELSKSYMKVHQNKVHQMKGNDATAKAVIEDEENNSDYDIDDDIIVGDTGPHRSN